MSADSPCEGSIIPFIDDSNSSSCSSSIADNNDRGTYKLYQILGEEPTSLSHLLDGAVSSDLNLSDHVEQFNSLPEALPTACRQAKDHQEQRYSSPKNEKSIIGSEKVTCRKMSTRFSRNSFPQYKNPQIYELPNCETHVSHHHICRSEPLIDSCTEYCDARSGNIKKRMKDCSSSAPSSFSYLANGVRTEKNISIPRQSKVKTSFTNSDSKNSREAVNLVDLCPKTFSWNSSANIPILATKVSTDKTSVSELHNNTSVISSTVKFASNNEEKNSSDSEETKEIFLQYPRPHFQTPSPNAHLHYISTARVSSRRGAADMGGALVSRVADFLRSQYKSNFGSPVLIPWCPQVKFYIKDFEANLVDAPMSSYRKSSTHFFSIESIFFTERKFSGRESLLERPKRILIEGDYGFYSANVCLRLAYDWAMLSNVSYMHQFRLVFVLTLRDFRGGSLFNYMCKEILPRHILSKEAMNTIWNYLTKIQHQILFMMLGFDELLEDEAGDLKELFHGQVLPNATVVLSRKASAASQMISPHPVFRHFKYIAHGLEPHQSVKIFRRCYAVSGWTDEDEISFLNSALTKYSNLLYCPILCAALCLLYNESGEKLPSKLTNLFMALVKSMVRKNLQRRGESMFFGVLPEKYTKLLQEFGKLALDGLKSGVTLFTGSDLKTKISRGSDLVSLGILLRLKSMSKLNKKDYYAPAHVALLEFCAAFFLSSLSSNCDQMHTELDSLARAFNLSDNSNTKEPSGILVLRFLVGLLGRNSNFVFNVLSQMGLSHRLFFVLLEESGMAQMNVIEVCRHVTCKNQVFIRTNCPELVHWGRLLYSPDCTLEGAEIILDLDGAKREDQELFFSSFAFNESIKNVKLTCVVAGTLQSEEITRLTSYVRAIMTKRHLETLEIAVTTVSDDVGSDTSVSSSIFDVICDTLPSHARDLRSLSLAMDIQSDQVLRLCPILRWAPWVNSLHLPRLTCDSFGFEAIARLLQDNPIVSLNLTGCGSAISDNEERSFSCSGNLSLTANSISSLDDNCWLYVDAKGISRSVFNSLPRSFYTSTPRRPKSPSSQATSGSRSCSLSGLPKSSSFPLPKCCPDFHHNAGFHHLFSALKSQSSKISHLNLSKCFLSAEDLVCLGEMVSCITTLSSFHMRGVCRIAELVPLLVGLQENRSLQLLDISSPHVMLDDAALSVTLTALRRNSSIKYLALSGWTFHLESKASLQELVSFMGASELRHLDINDCVVCVTVTEGSLTSLSRRDDVASIVASVTPPIINTSLSFLNVDNLQVRVNDTVLSGHQLLFFLRHMPKLVDLTISTKVEDSEALDEVAFTRMMQLIPVAFPTLRRICLAGWIFRFGNREKVIRTAGRHLRRSQLKEVDLSGVTIHTLSNNNSRSCVDSAVAFLGAFTSNLHHLSSLSIRDISLSLDQISSFGKVLRDKMRTDVLNVETKGIDYFLMRIWRQSLTEGAKYRVIFNGGPTALYVVKKCQKRENIIGKWVCGNSLKLQYGSDSGGET